MTTAHTHNTSPQPTTGLSAPALVHTTAQSGPARQLIDEWERLSISRPTLRKVNSWGLTPEPITHLDEMLVHAGFGRPVDDSAADHVLWQLICRAENDDLAARIVLHRVLPSVLSIAQRRGRIMRGGMSAALDEAVPTAWMVIRTFPHQRRQAKIAANLARDIEYHAFVRQARLRSVDIDLNGHNYMPMLASPPEYIDPATEAHDLISDAAQAGLSRRHVSVLREMANGVSTIDAAKARDMSPRTMRNHKNYAISAIKRVHKKSLNV
jgi:hypothetical protein